jgi:dipeptidyl aminopeptidase/acylaminoacyl peptidase
MRHSIVKTLLLVVGASVPALAQKRGVAPEDYYRMVDVVSVAMAPDGHHVAFTTGSVVEAQNRRHSEVWLATLRDGALVGQPTRFTDPNDESTLPSWSPDGSVLSFVSSTKHASSVKFRNVGQGAAATYAVAGVRGSPHWSPDGKWIAYTWMPTADSAARGAKAREGWISPNAISHTLNAERMDGHVVTAMHYKSDGTLALLQDPSVIPQRQLYVVAAAGGTPRRLTNFSFAVSEPVWSPDGESLFVGGDSLWDVPSVHQVRDIYVVSRNGGAPRAITSNPGSEYSPAVSPDGKSLAYLHTQETGAELDLMVVALGPGGVFQGTPRNLTADWSLNPGAPAWTPDGRALRFLAGIGGNAHLFEVAAAGGSVRQVTQGARQLSLNSYSADGTLMAYAATDASRPGEVFVARADGSAEHRLSGLNDSWLTDVTIMPTERLTWKVADGTQIEGWVVKPVGYVPGKKYPLILKIHGGPHGAYGQTFFQQFHVLSAAGFFVLYSNPRGSSNYGNKFEYATRGNWLVMDTEDFLGGVDAAIAKYSDIDPERVGVSGGSYGGVSTNWLTAYTNRFSAAVSSRSIANWYSWWGTADIPEMTEFEFYGTPWEQPERYARLSPFTHVKNVTAPTLLIEGENDYRTPMVEGEEWYMALKKLGVPAELVRYPRSSHGVSRNGEPWLLVDRLERIRSWFAYWLLDHPDRLPKRNANMVYHP